MLDFFSFTKSDFNEKWWLCLCGGELSLVLFTPCWRPVFLGVTWNVIWFLFNGPYPTWSQRRQCPWPERSNPTALSLVWTRPDLTCILLLQLVLSAVQKPPKQLCLFHSHKRGFSWDTSVHWVWAVVRALAVAHCSWPVSLKLMDGWNDIPTAMESLQIQIQFAKWDRIFT